MDKEQLMWDFKNMNWTTFLEKYPECPVMITAATKWVEEQTGEIVKW